MGTLSRNIIWGKTLACVEYSGISGAENLYAVKAKVQKSELEITEKETFSGTKEAVAFLSSKPQTHLVFNNHQVLLKETVASNAPMDVLVNQVFPNIELAAFYHEVLRTKTKTYVAVCRKTYVQQVLEQYAKEGIIVSSWSLGVLNVAQLLPFIKHQDIIGLPQQELAIQDGQITAITPNDSEGLVSNYSVEDMDVPAAYIVPFGGVLRLFTNFDFDQVSNSTEDHRTQQTLFKQHRLFKKGLPVAIGTLLIIFLVNFLFYNSYYSEVERLKGITMINGLQRKNLVIKDSIVNEKQKLFDDVIASSASTSSLYVDAVVGTMPEALLLDQLTFQPLLRKIRAKKPLEFEKEVLHIKGKTQENDALSSWITTLEDMAFIKEVGIEIGSTKKGLTQFELLIQLKP